MSDRNALARLAALAQPTVVPVLDPGFRPAALVEREFERMARETGRPERLVIGLERGGGASSNFETALLPSDHPDAQLNLAYAERTLKFLLWSRGGWRVTVGGPKAVFEHLAATFSATGARKFDHETVGLKMFERPLTFEHCGPDEVPKAKESAMAIGRNLEGCRVGFDLGASDRKSSAVVDGEPIHTEEVVWQPRENSDPAYHYAEIKKAIESSASKMPRLDAIGGSSAGVVIDNRVMVASLFRGVAEADFDRYVKDIFLRIGEDFGVPIDVANDGDVTALAGAMSLEAGNLLGVAMGSSEAAGYADRNGNVTGWINELAFAPIDFRPDAPIDEWSADRGCGVQYLTQQAVFRLAPSVGIEPVGETLAAKLKSVQTKLEAGHEGAAQIWETIGAYCGYAIAHYARFYEIERMLVLGRVTSGLGGPAVVEGAKKVLDADFPKLAKKVNVFLPDEKTRRVGQAVAAASLPKAVKA